MKSKRVCLTVDDEKNQSTMLRKGSKILVFSLYIDFFLYFIMSRDCLYTKLINIQLASIKVMETSNEKKIGKTLAFQGSLKKDHNMLLCNL